TPARQNAYLAANCKILGSSELWFLPNVAPFRLPCGGLKFVGFKTLKNSNLSSKRCRSRIWKVRVRLLSMLKKPGAISELYPALPNVPPAFGPKAFGSIQRSEAVSLM